MPKITSPKYSSECQTLINAIVAANHLKGCEVMISQAAADYIMTRLPEKESKMFALDPKFGGFQITLKQ